MNIHKLIYFNGVIFGMKEFTAKDFREIFLKSVFDYLHENGIQLFNIEDVFSRYQEDHIAHSINMGFNMAMEQLVDRFLLNQNIVTENELGTELENEFRIEFSPESGKPTLYSNYKLFYKMRNLNLTFDSRLDLDELNIDETLNKIMRGVIAELRKQL
jgi:hypothetical protein